jgi:hypothetical protein
LAAKEDRERAEATLQLVSSLKSNLENERLMTEKLKSNIKSLREENTRLEIRASSVTRPDIYPVDANQALVQKQKEIEAGRAQIAQLLMIVNGVS